MLLAVVAVAIAVPVVPALINAGYPIVRWLLNNYTSINMDRDAPFSAPSL